MSKSIKQALQDALGNKALKTAVTAKKQAPPPVAKPSVPVAGYQVTAKVTGKARVTLSLPPGKARYVVLKPVPKGVLPIAPPIFEDRNLVRAKPGKQRVPLPRPPSGGRLSAAQAINKTRMAQQARKAEIQAQQALVHLANAYGTNKPAPLPALSLWKLEIEPTAVPNGFFAARPAQYDVTSPPNSGISEQMPGTDGSDDEREVVIGLDFGTSSVKVIVGDLAAGSAFAVPFSNSEGIDRYLLPSRLWQANDRFSLLGGFTAHRDLKLSLLSEGHTPDDVQRAAVFLALVLRHVRGWLFSVHAETYANTRFVWKVVLGIPAKSYEVNPEQPFLTKRFKLVAQAAWLLAGKRLKEIDGATAGAVVTRAGQLLDGAAPKSESEEIEVDVVPELSAQIYGFLKSTRFDRNGFNHFMMVDVGAGTVDSSLFQVVQGSRGKWNFKFYTNNVQQIGVMNLHRYRVQWWADALKGRPDPAPGMLKILGQSEFPTDFLGRIPECLEDYISGTRLSFGSKEKHPDQEFFKKRVVAQVRGATLYRARDFLDQYKLAGIPVFLCGGGVRMKFYRQLEEELKYFEGFTWLKAIARPLGVPANLQAPGLVSEDYDRLSVAFGLSFLDVGEIVRALPEPFVAPPRRADPSSGGYISKDDV